MNFAYRIAWTILSLFFLIGCRPECHFSPKLKDLRNSLSSDWQKVDATSLISMTPFLYPYRPILPQISELEEVKDQWVFDSIYNRVYHANYQKLNFDSFTYLIHSVKFKGIQVSKDFFINHLKKELVFYYRMQTEICKSDRNENRGYDNQTIWKIPKLPPEYRLIVKHE